MENKLKWFEKVLQLTKEYGIWTIFKAGIAIIFIAYVMIITLNPGIVYEKFKEYVEIEHTENQALRQEATLKIKYKIKDLLIDSGADRAWVIEYHNSVTGLGGLPFIYGSMISEYCRNGVKSIGSHYNNFLLSDYTFLAETSKVGGGIFNIEQIKDIDQRMYYSFKSNSVNNVALFHLKSEDKDIGILGLSYTESEIPKDVWIKLRDAGISISVILSKTK